MTVTEDLQTIMLSTYFVPVILVISQLNSHWRAAWTVARVAASRLGQNTKQTDTTTTKRANLLTLHGPLKATQAAGCFVLHPWLTWHGVQDGPAGGRPAPTVCTTAHAGPSTVSLGAGGVV